MDSEVTKAKERVITEFKKKRLRQLLALLPLILAGVGLVFLDKCSDELLGISKMAALSTCIGLILLVGVFTFFNWRCPACNRYLGKTINPKFCSSCGARLS